ncbi:sensor histidine kinase [Psychromonas ossibalaenae]|uniref:sensor histidine kinase n=1 Tax=Psychromonas ossibalaenae TaxID=444922 RepID=UPI000378DD55|nr:cache domain-containing protein [Psychromonas ossibalaenae]
MNWLYQKLVQTKLTCRLIVVYSTVFLVIISITVSAILFNVKKVITTNIESELQNSSYLINSMIKTALDTSIKTHLRTTSEVALENAAYYYDLYKKGELSEPQAKEKALSSIRPVKIGTTGYMYILDSTGKLLYHPYKALQYTNISQYDFIKKQIKNKNGYIEYMWSNPGDTTDRSKALYMRYFAPWDWIVSASSYRSEFSDLLNLSDFEQQVTGVKFGQDGYPVILDNQGTFLVHPSLKGRNLIAEQDPRGAVVSEIIKNKNGIIEYDWKNPSDKVSRKKVLVYSELKEYNWIIASSAYKSDFYGALNDVTKIIVIALLFSLLIMTAVTVKISAMVIKPIKKLEETVLKGVNGDLSVRVAVNGGDEINQLGIHFNNFIESLETNNAKLHEEIIRRQNISGKLAALNENLEEVVKDRTKELHEAQNEIIQSEKLTAVNRLIKDIAHNINTPLGISITSATYIEDLVAQLHQTYNEHKISKKNIETFFNQHDKSYELLMSGLQRSANLIDMFKLLTRDDVSLTKDRFNVKREIEKSISMLRLGEHKITLTCEEDIEINSYSAVFDLIINNILSNSLTHGYDIDKSGLIDVNVVMRKMHLSILISDNGKGISEQDLHSVFEPFYTNKSSTNAGLGLSIVQHSVKDILNGTIEIKSTIESGTEVKLEIPIV